MPLYPLLISVVLAHQPHAVLVDAARAPDGAMLAILDPHDASQIVTSEDGRHFAFTGGEAADEDLSAAAFVDATWVLGDAGGGVWTSSDRRSWSRAAVLETPITALDGGSSLLVATRAGLWSGPPDALTVEAADTAFVDAAWGGTARVAVAADGRVWSGRASTPLLALAPLPAQAKALSAALADAPYAGSDDGVFRFDGAWQRCSALPVEDTGPYANAVHLLVADGDALLAATGAEALFVSTDACATWARRWTGDVVVIGGIGYAKDATEAFVWADLDGAVLRVAGFDGLAYSDDDGASWTHPDLLPADYSRGVSLGKDRLYLGEYAGGVAFTDDGAVWSSSGTGLTGLHGNDLVAGPGDDEVWHMTDLIAHRSEDGGATWRALEAPMERAREVRLLDDGVWLLGGDEHGDTPGSRIARTTDGGASWTTDDDYAAVAGENAILDLFDARVDGTDLRVALLQKPAGLVLRDGTWTSSPTFDGFASGAVAWPPRDARRLVLATTEGVLLSDDRGASFVPAAVPPDGHPRALLQDDDGGLVLVDRAGRTWASDDGGDTWARVDNGLLPAAVHDTTELSDGFAVVATTTGPWWTDDGGSSWHAAPRLQRLETDGLHVLRDGARLRFSCFGDAFRVLAPGSIGVTAVVDGSPVTLDDRRATLALGWHDVELTADDVDRIDAIECTTPGSPIPMPRACGCGHAPRWDFTAPLTLVVLVRRRVRPR